MWWCQHTSRMALIALVVMGVSASGKSTVAELVAAELGWPYADGDSFHSVANVAKMANGHPLSDADRAPWLAAIRDWMTAVLQTESSCVVACSALRRTYRDVLRQAATATPTAELRFAFLDVDRDTLRERIIARHGHFMHANMLDSQLETLEVPGPDENAVSVHFSNAMTPESAAAAIVATLPAEALRDHRSSVFRMPRSIDDL